ncbi:Aldo/keto reductase [Dendrothele bispora CBS 962.96]|uniref:Aldo/keto reductase n=1 Tax=Dendrothele bispora (strain CBS 962.96) TaxID=1314807 RepID=A0A4S8LLI0_DENBC|nr:Aldo/keto reductase [Dendrothele bispora CBS 962.96]
MPVSDTEVQYVRLGKSGLRVSVPIFGALSIGSPKWDKWILEEEKSLEILKAAWDHGINTIDTANIYSNGESERIIAKFIEMNKIPRNEILILTKCNGLVHKDVGVRTVLQPQLRDTREYVNQSGLSRDAIFNAVDASLSRLKTSYIDLLQIHQEIMKALHDLVQSGGVRYVGACSMRTWQLALLNEVADKNGWTKFVSMQSEYSLLYREEERDMHAYCNYHGVGLIPWATVAAGLLARPVGEKTTRAESAKGTMFEQTTTESDKLIINRVQEIARKRGKSMAQIALAWVNAKVASPIIGLSSEKRVEEAVSINGFHLSDEELKYLEEPYQPKAVRAHP